MITEVKTKRTQCSNSFLSVMISWLGIWFVVQPLPQESDKQDLQRSTQEIRILLDFIKYLRDD